MPFASKWDLLTVPKQQEIANYAKEHGKEEAVAKYWLETNMSKQGLRQKLDRLLGDDDRKTKIKETKLSRKETELLNKIKRGEVSGIDEINKIVIATIYEKMLKNPHDIKFIDFFRGQLLELKKQEQTDKNNMMQDLVNRMFSGKLPPTICPHCNKPLYESHVTAAPVLEGEVIND